MFYEDDDVNVRIHEATDDDVSIVRWDLCRIPKNVRSIMDIMAPHVDARARYVIYLRHVTTDTLAPPTISQMLEIMTALSHFPWKVRLVIVQGTVVDDVCEAALALYRSVVAPRYEIVCTASDAESDRMCESFLQRRRDRRTK